MKSVQDEAISAWRYLESRQITPSARRVAAMLRAIGMRVDDHRVRAWLKDFQPAVHRTTTASVTADSTAPREHASPHTPPGDHRESTCGFAREKEVLLVPSLVSYPSGTRRGAAQTRLRLVDKTEVVARELLDTLWPRVAATVSRAMTRTAWKRQNKATALDLARSGVTVDAVLQAHSDASDAAGETLWALHRVQAHLLRSPAPTRPTLTAVPRAKWLSDAIERGQAVRREHA